MVTTDKKYRIIVLTKEKTIKSLILKERPKPHIVANFAYMNEASSFRIEELDHVSPSDGGCCFCKTRTADILYDVLYDVYVHKECLQAEIENNPENREAQLMAHLLE